MIDLEGNRARFQRMQDSEGPAARTSIIVAGALGLFLCDIVEEARERDESARIRIKLARDALVATGYFKADEVGDDIAPRIVELNSALRGPVIDALSQLNSGNVENAKRLLADLLEVKR